MTSRPTLTALPSRFDLIVIGAGITGAGIFNEAAGRGRHVLLVDRRDFASGTSSGSSKLVHGGLRYLKSGQWRLTLESVRERNRMLRERAGLVERQPFLMPVYAGQKPGLAMLRTGLALYDAMGGERSSRRLDAAAALALEPGLRRDGLLGAVSYDDARTDDARLTLKLIFEAQGPRAISLNYCAVSQILRSGGRVHGVSLQDAVSGETREIAAGVVIDAAGVDAASLPDAPHGAPPLRPLRGSHLIFPLDRLPIRRAVSWLHPRDRRPVFVYPWEGVALLGTTDVDHPADAALRMSPAEADYLMEALAHQFPLQTLSLSDAIASTAGVRPIVAGGKADPSAESRESAIWSSPGWVGITGGKLTTFRVTALQVLKAAARQISIPPAPRTGPEPAADRWVARYGEGFRDWQTAVTSPADQEPIPATPYRWSELRWAARAEQVVHLDDLLMRRLRLSLLLPSGGEALLDRIGSICREELGWDEPRWQQERARYLRLWSTLHAVEP
jgi:glycerol-3-phosphate dehydrogenase